MRYWHPDTEEAIAALESAPFDELVLLPLYPHYSFATTGSSLKEWNRLYKPRVPVQLIDHFFDHPDYIAGIVERINSVLAAAPAARGSPSRVQRAWPADGAGRKGRPVSAAHRSDRPLVRELGSWPNPHVLCFQSRVGPQKWLSLRSPAPSSDGQRRHQAPMLVIPISFLTEHIETLHEINIEAREHAESLGITEFHMMPALNDSPLLIRALADLVLRSVGRRSGVATLAL